MAERKTAEQIMKKKAVIRAEIERKMRPMHSLPPMMIALIGPS